MLPKIILYFRGTNNFVIDCERKNVSKAKRKRNRERAKKIEECFD